MFKKKTSDKEQNANPAQSKFIPAILDDGNPLIIDFAASQPGDEVKEQIKAQEDGRFIQGVIAAKAGKPFEDLEADDYLGIKELDFSGKPISCIKVLESFCQLSRLFLLNTQVSDIGPLEKLINLSLLDLSDTPVSDLRPLAELTHLTVLSLSNTRIIDLRPLEKLTRLSRLYLIGTAVTDLGPLEKLKNLAWLYLDNMTAFDLAQLKKLTCLRGLSLHNTPVTDLAGPRLETKVGGNTRMSNITKLRTLLPNCSIIAE